MKAVVFSGHEQVAVETVPDPSVESASDVLVRIESAAICGSDLHPFHGREKGLDPGTVMGHEGVGRIVETGREVTRLKAGDRVVSPFTTNCGRCRPCAAGLTARCDLSELFGWRSDGRGLHGMQAEYVRIPMAEATLVGVPEEIDDASALLLGDIFSTGWFCSEMGEVGEGTECVVVVGCGPVGLMAVAAARMKGAQKIVAVDSVAERLELAGRFGAMAVDYTGTDTVALVHEETGGRGAGTILEVVGAPAALRLAVDLVRPGGIIASVGVHTAPEFSFSPSEAYDRNLTFRTGRCPARHYMERLLPEILKTDLPLTDIITHRMALEDGPEGYRLFDGRLEGCIKVVLEP